MLALSLLSGCSKSGGEAPGSAAADVAARVNGVVIPGAMVTEAIDLFLAQQRGRSPEPTEAERSGMRTDVLEALINQELMLQEAEQDGITAESAEIDRQMGELVSQHGSPEAMREQLAEVGMTQDGVKQLLERNMIIEKFLRQRVDELLNVTDSDVETYYNEHSEEMQQPEMVRASHILINYREGTDSPADGEAARARANDLLERARKGEEFAILAQQNSQDGSAARGGDLGLFPRGRMVSPFDEAAFSLGVGELSGLVATPFGFHIIKVAERRPAKTLVLGEVSTALKQHLESQERERLSRELIAELASEARIERF